MFGDFTSIDTVKNGRNTSAYIFYKGLDLGFDGVDREGRHYTQIGDIRQYDNSSPPMQEQLTSDEEEE